MFFTKLLLLAAVFPTRAGLYLNNLEFSMLKPALLAGIWSLINCHKLPDVSKQLWLYSIKLYVSIEIQIWFASSTNTSLISVVHVENGAHFLNATSVLLLTVTVIFPETKKNASK